MSNKTKESNIKYLFGFLGSTLFATISSLVWVLFYTKFEINFGALTALIPIAGFYGYKLCKGKMKNGIFIFLTLAVAIATLLSCFVFIPLVNGEEIASVFTSSEASVERFRTHMGFGILISLLMLIFILVRIKLQMEKNVEEIQLFKDGSYEDTVKKYMAIYEPIFKKRKATSKERSLSKKEIIDELDDKSADVLEGIKVLNSCGIIEKSGTRYYYSGIEETQSIRRTIYESGKMLYLIGTVLAMGLIVSFLMPISREIKVDIKDGDVQKAYEYKISLDWQLPDSEHYYLVLDENKITDENLLNQIATARNSQSNYYGAVTRADDFEDYMFFLGDEKYSSNDITDLQLNAYADATIQLSVEINSGYENYEKMKSALKTYMTADDVQVVSEGSEVEFLDEITTSNGYRVFPIKIYSLFKEIYLYYIYDSGRVGYITLTVNDFSVKEKALKDVKYILNTFKFKSKNTETKNEEDNLPYVTRNVTTEGISSSEINL